MMPGYCPFFLSKMQVRIQGFSLVNCTSKSQASSHFALFEFSVQRTCHRTGNSRYSSKHFVKKSRLMNILDMEADMVPPLVTKLALFVRVVWPCGCTRLAWDHPHTYEPIASRRRAKPHRRSWRTRLMAPPHTDDDFYSQNSVSGVIPAHLKMILSTAL
jgi:hypothetical protein